MVTTLQECELYAALSHWLTTNSYATSYRVIVDFPAFGHSDLVDKVEWRTPPPVLPTAQNLIDAYNAYLVFQDTLADQATIAENAEAQAAAIPQWASWTEAQALDWHNTNITTQLPVANLTAANTVLQKLDAENRALIRMVLALRNKIWPNLQG